MVQSALEMTCSFEVVRATAEEQSDDESEQTKDRRENLNDQDLDETIEILAICNHMSLVAHPQLTVKGPQHRPKQH